jgi:protein-glutamine gamma-glutamyltransferase
MLKLYSLLTCIIAFAGCISLFISGEINMILALPGTAVAYGYYRSFRSLPQAPKKAVSLLSATTLLIFIADIFFLSDDYLVSVANLTILFQGIKSYDLKEPWDNLQVCFMSLLQLIITSELTHSLAFGALFILFLIAFVIAMVLAHFQKEGVTVDVMVKRKPLLYITLLTLFVTVVIFISVPRISGGIWGKSHMQSIKTAGFSERVDFGSFGNVKMDPTIVMRIELAGKREVPYYWRGMSLNYFDGVAWRDREEGRKWMYKRDGYFTFRSFKKEEAAIQRIYLEAMDTDLLFGLREIAALEINSRVITHDDAYALFLPYKKGKQVSYTVYSIPEEPSQDSGNRYYLQVPEGMRKVMQLARTITAGKKRDIEQAAAIEKYLRENYTYSLSTAEPPRGVSPLEYFLFDSRKGYCEHYATAMVLMLRSLGIPARIVMGFYGGELNTYGEYIIVRQSDAHSWVEALIDKRWKRFDPTPAVAVGKPSAIDLYLDMLRMKWNRYVVSFSSSDQRQMIRFFTLPFRMPHAPGFSIKGIKELLYALLFTAGFVLILFLISHYRLRRYGFITLQYIRLRNAMKKRGIEITPSCTPAEIERKAVGTGNLAYVAEFIKMYEEFRFGNKEMGDEDRERYLMLLSGIRRQLKS